MPFSTAPCPDLPANASTTCGCVNEARAPESTAVPKMARNGGTRQSESRISRTSGSRLTGEIQKTFASASSAAVVSAVDADEPNTSPMTTKITRLMQKDGPTVQSIPRMCWLTVTPPTIEGISTVVSDRGDILSPMYAPDTTAPAAIGAETPRTGAMPTNATPSVPAVVQELPVTMPTTAQITATAP